MKKIIILSSMLFLSIGYSLAPSNVGNGGDAVVCRNNKKITSIELLDFYEAKSLRNIKYDLMSSELSVEDKIELALKRLERLSPKRSIEYREEVEEFYRESVFLKDIYLIDVPDSEHVAIPRGCSIEQVVIQKGPIFPGDKKYTINKNLWDKMDNDNRAALILHEVIYGEALRSGHENSIATRYFNSYITSLEFDKLNNKSLIGFFERISFHTVKMQGALLDLKKSKPIFYENDNLKEASVVDYSSLIYQGKIKKVYGVISFYKNKKIDEVSLSGPTEISVPYKDNLNTFSVSRKVKHHPDGSIERLWLWDDYEEDTRARASLYYDNISFDLVCNNSQRQHIYFWPNGRYKKSDSNCDLQEDTFFPHGRDMLNAVSGYEVKMHEDGSIAQGVFSDEYIYSPVEDSKITIPALTIIDFRKDGTVSFTYDMDSYPYDHPPSIIELSKGKFIVDYIGETYDNGMPKEVKLKFEKQYYLKIQERKIEIRREDFTLYQNGMIKTFMLKKETKLKRADGTEKLFSKWTVIEVNEDELVVRAN